MKENKTEFIGAALPVVFEAPVTHGRQIGRRLGAPTLNQRLPDEINDPERIPYGVYFSRCHFDGRSYPAVTNVGVAPTVTDVGEVRCESHLFGFSGDIYDKTVKTELLFFHRPEMRFSSQTELSETIGRDIEEALSYFENNK